MSESLFVRQYLMFSAFILIWKLILLSCIYWLYWSVRSIGFLFFRFRFRVLIEFLFRRSFGFYNGFGVLNDRVWFTLLYIFKGFFFFIKLISDVAESSSPPRNHLNLGAGLAAAATHSTSTTVFPLFSLLILTSYVLGLKFSPILSWTADGGMATVTSTSGVAGTALPLASMEVTWHFHFQLSSSTALLTEIPHCRSASPCCEIRPLS